jgi:hypothetical protein
VVKPGARTPADEAEPAVQDTAAEDAAAEAEFGLAPAEMADSTIGRAAGGTANEAPIAVPPSALDLEEAERRIGADVLIVLAEKFRGKLTEVRRPDGEDQFF